VWLTRCCCCLQLAYLGSSKAATVTLVPAANVEPAVTVASCRVSVGAGAKDRGVRLAHARGCAAGAVFVGG
jgi:hypothetical protein